MAKRVCSRPGCPTLVDADAYRGLCADHRKQRDRDRGTKAERGYGPDFVAARAAFMKRIAAGDLIECWRCGEPVTADFHLGHDDNRSLIRGPEHPLCNLRAAGKASHRN